MADQAKPADVVEIGPVAPSAGGVIYQITLESGAIVTSPMGFPKDSEPPAVPRAIVTSDGRVLVAAPLEPAEEAEEADSGFERFSALAKSLLGVPKDEAAAVHSAHSRVTR